MKSIKQSLKGLGPSTEERKIVSLAFLNKWVRQKAVLKISHVTNVFILIALKVDLNPFFFFCCNLSLLSKFAQCNGNRIMTSSFAF